MMEKIKTNRNYLKVYEFGSGKVSIQSGLHIFKDNETLEEKFKIPFIDLSTLEEKRNIGEELDLDPKANDYVKLTFTNIDSLEVFQKALNFCREQLESKKLIG